MAFQTGTKVDPRLMKADLSGFARGTELAMAGIASAVSGYAKKKKEKEQNKLAAEALVGAVDGNPYLRSLFPEGDLSVENVLPAVKAMGAKNAMSFLIQSNLLQTKAGMKGGGPLDITQFTNAVEKSGFTIDEKTGKLQRKGTFKSVDVDPIKDKDLMPKINALRESNKKLFDQYFGSQFGTATTAAPSAGMSAGFGFEDFSFEELD